MSDCAVWALSNLTDLTYAGAEEALACVGRRPAQGTPIQVLLAALDERAAVERWSGGLRQALLDGGRFLFAGSGHCFTVVSGHLLNFAPTPPPIKVWRVTDIT